MMARFYGYINKVFQFQELTSRLTDSRLEAGDSHRGRVRHRLCHVRHLPRQSQRHRQGTALSGTVAKPRRAARSQRRHGRPGVRDSWTASALREVLRDVHLRIKRNKMLRNTTDWMFAAVDGHEFFRQPQTLLRPVPHPHLDSG